MSNLAIRYLKEQMTPENEDNHLLIIGEYIDMILKFMLAKKGVNTSRQTQIQRLYENGKISMDITRKIRRQINIWEAYWMEENGVQTH